MIINAGNALALQPFLLPGGQRSTKLSSEAMANQGRQAAIPGRIVVQKEAVLTATHNTVGS